MNRTKLINILIAILAMVFILEAIALIKGVDGACLASVIGVFLAIVGIIGTVLRYEIKKHHEQKGKEP